MMNRHALIIGTLGVLSLGAGRCVDDERLTVEEALASVEEVSTASQALTLTSGTVEIATDFTIGEAVETAAEEIRDFMEAQLPCAEVTLIGSTLNVEYGVNGVCYYKDQLYSGSHEITITSTAPGELIVDHVWTGLTNGTLEVSGTARVTWSSASANRHIEHTLEWTRRLDGKEWAGSGDRYHSALPAGIEMGFVEDGTREWTSSRGDWDLDIDELEMRWSDPVPQDGTLTLDTPYEKQLTLEFERLGASTIQATVTSGSTSFDFNVTAFGLITES